MSHNDAGAWRTHNEPGSSKRIKLTQEGELITLITIDNGHSVEDSKGKIGEQNITNFCLYNIDIHLDIGSRLTVRYSFFSW